MDLMEYNKWKLWWLWRVKVTQSIFVEEESNMWEIKNIWGVIWGEKDDVDNFSNYKNILQNNIELRENKGEKKLVSK